jgi:hypothetical protein
MKKREAYLLMGLSERNKKVAIARWKNIHTKERELIPKTKFAILLKSAISGLLAGDGSVQVRKKNSHYQVDFFPDDLEMLDFYCKSIFKLYKKRPLIIDKESYYSVRFTSKVAVIDLRNYASFGLKSWRIPRFKYSSDCEKINWLKGFFSAEAYVGKDCIRVQTVNKVGMVQISNLLNKLKIDHKTYSYLPKRENHSMVYIITILKKEARILYFERIGFYHQKKVAKLQETLNL